MALRSEAQHRCRLTSAAGCFLVLASIAAAAEYPVTHVHLRRDEPGSLRIDADGLGYTETKPHKKPHDYRWTWNDVQKVVLEPDRIEITTYKDVKWLAGQDQQFTFRGKDLDATYPILVQALPRRLVADIAIPVSQPLAAELPAKRVEGRTGHEGTLRIASELIVFQSTSNAGSHTWPLNEVENISSSDPLELTIASLGTDYRLQLKRPLSQDIYNSLWRKLNVKGTH